MMRFVIYILLSSLISFSAQAEEFCFRDSVEYEKYKDKMPEIFKKIPIVIGTEDVGTFFDVFVVLKIYIQNQAIVLSSDSWQGTGRYSDKGEVERVCFDTVKKELLVVFNNKKEFKATYSNTEIKVTGAVLKRISSEDQRRIISRINGKVNKGSGSDQSSESGAGN